MTSHTITIREIEPGRYDFGGGVLATLERDGAMPALPWCCSANGERYYGRSMTEAVSVAYYNTRGAGAGTVAA